MAKFRSFLDSLNRSNIYFVLIKSTYTHTKYVLRLGIFYSKYLYYSSWKIRLDLISMKSIYIPEVPHSNVNISTLKNYLVCPLSWWVGLKLSTLIGLTVGCVLEVYWAGVHSYKITAPVVFFHLLVEILGTALFMQFGVFEWSYSAVDLRRW